MPQKKSAKELLLENKQLELASLNAQSKQLNERWKELSVTCSRDPRLSKIDRLEDQRFNLRVKRDAAKGTGYAFFIKDDIIKLNNDIRSEYNQLSSDAKEYKSISLKLGSLENRKSKLRREISELEQSPDVISENDEATPKFGQELHKFIEGQLNKLSPEERKQVFERYRESLITLKDKKMIDTTQDTYSNLFKYKR